MSEFLPANLSVITAAKADRLVPLAALPQPWGVTSLAFSPDGTQLATAHEALRLWSLRSGDRDMSLQAGEGVVQAIAFSPDGRLVVAASTDHVVRLWAAAVGVQMGTLRSPRTVLRSVDVSADGRWVAAGSGDFYREDPAENVVHVWDARANWACTTLDAPRSAVCVSFSPDGSQLAAGEIDGVIRLWPVDNWQTPRTFKLSGVMHLAFSPDGSKLAAGAHSAEQGGVIGLWNITNSRMHRRLNDPGDVVYSVAFSRDGSLIASGGGDAVNAPSAVRLWEVESGAQVAELAAHGKPVECVTFSPDGRLLASGGGDGVRLWGVLA